MRPVKVHNKLLEIASKEAINGNVQRSKMSALALSPSHRRILAKSHNTRTMGSTQWTLHAEERLLAKCREYIDTILVYRENGSGTSKPCERCARLIKEAGVKRVIYFDGNKWVTENVA